MKPYFTLRSKPSTTKPSISKTLNGAVEGACGTVESGMSASAPGT